MKPLDRRPDCEGHLLLLYPEESYLRTGVAAWLRRGLEFGAKILYIEPRGELPARALSGLIQDEPDAGEAVERGQIEVILADRTAYDPVWQAGVVQDALRQGYPSVRLSAEATTAWSVLPRARHAEVERTIDQMCQSLPVSVMCQYPARDSMEVLGPVSTVHGSGLREWPCRSRVVSLSPERSTRRTMPSCARCYRRRQRRPTGTRSKWT